MKNHLKYLRSISIWSVIMLGLLHSCNKPEKPNFLFLFSDDQTFESIHAWNNPEVLTPTLDKLFESGVTFTHTFNQGSWAGAVCVASRAMLNTGQTVFRTTRNTKYLEWWSTMYGDNSWQLQKEPGVEYPETEVETWAETFSEAGYLTFLTGKWHNSEYALLKSFEEAQAVGEGMYETFDDNGSNKMAYNRPNESDWTPWDSAYKGHWAPNVKDIIYSSSGEKKIGAHYTVEQHTSDLYADRAVNFLQTTAKNSSRPFFMYVAFNAPHDPRQSPEEYVNIYKRNDLKLPETFLPEHPFNQGDNRIRDEVLCVFPRTPEAVKLHRQEYYAIISHFDAAAGRIIDALKQTGKLDQTYIIFTSDHGLAIGQHGLMGKQNQYDHSIRMPLIISGPDLEKGKQIDKMVYMQSIFATSCDLAGIEIPESVEFSSLNGLLNGQESSGEKYIFGTYRHLQRMIRSEDFKLIVYPDVKRIQLFDLKKDPLEMNDLSVNPDYQNIIDNLFDELILLQKELDDFIILDKTEYNHRLKTKPG